MPTCPPNLTHSLLTVCEIITFKVDLKAFFFYAKGGQQSFGSLKTVFWSWYGLLEFTILFIVELGACLQNLTPTRGVEHW
jgi:hypothetical protein